MARQHDNQVPRPKAAYTSSPSHRSAHRPKGAGERSHLLAGPCGMDELDRPGARGGRQEELALSGGDDLLGPTQDRSCHLEGLLPLLDGCRIVKARITPFHRVPGQRNRFFDFRR